MDSIKEDIDRVYEQGFGDPGMIEAISRYGQNIEACLILTNTDFQEAKQRVNKIADKIRNKVVLEIGAGVGFAAIEIAKHAQYVVAIENDPSWNWIFTKHLYKYKPDNLLWIFGNAEQVSGIFKDPFDVAIVFTRSGIDQMKIIASCFAPEVIMFYQEVEING